MPAQQSLGPGKQTDERRRPCAGEPSPPGPHAPGGRDPLCTTCRFPGWRWCSQAPDVKSPDTDRARHTIAPARGLPSTAHIQEARGHKSASVRGNSSGKGQRAGKKQHLCLTQRSEVCVARSNNIHALRQCPLAAAGDYRTLWTQESRNRSLEVGTLHGNPPTEMQILIKEIECPVEGREDKIEVVSSKLHKGAQITTGKGERKDLEPGVGRPTSSWQELQGTAEETQRTSREVSVQNRRTRVYRVKAPTV